MALRPRALRPVASRSPNRAFSQYETRQNDEIFYEDDFWGTTMQAPWDVVEVLLNTAIAGVDAEANGVVGLIMDADNNAEDAVLFHSDVRQFDIKQGAVFECRASIEVIPTLTGVCVFGMCGDHNLVKDTVAEHAWFRVESAGDLLVETDDTTNDNDDQDTTLDVTAGDWHVYQIDFGNLANVKFFVDGVRQLRGTTFDMSNLTDAEAHFQPYFSLDKGADVGLGTLFIDYCKIFSARA